MSTSTTVRKKRSDRNHVIYLLTNVFSGKQYIGITVAKGRAFKWSAYNRFCKHISRARLENKDWPLYKDMSKYRDEELIAYHIEVMQVVRGKAEAHEIETKLINKHKPKLNG
jgi:hypothetical protein